MKYRSTLFAAGILGGTGVALGAFGAHGLRDTLTERGLVIWDTAVRYQLLHAVGLLCVAMWLRQPTGPSGPIIRWTALSWVLGTGLFSGSLFALALGGPRWLGPITPLGGLLFVVGWILIVVAAARHKD